MSAEPGSHGRREVTKALSAAFPRELEADVGLVVSLLPAAGHGPTAHDIGPVVVGGEALHIPARVYFPEPDPVRTAQLSPTARTVIACLYTRHSDGHVRQRHAPRLLADPRPWVPPFVLQLVGEYVVEIVELLAAALDAMQHESYRSFAAENPQFLRLIRHRVISYWQCYHRSSHPGLHDYPGHRVLEALGLWDPHDGRRLLAR